MTPPGQVVGLPHGMHLVTCRSPGAAAAARATRAAGAGWGGVVGLGWGVEWGWEGVGWGGGAHRSGS